MRHSGGGVFIKFLKNMCHFPWWICICLIHSTQFKLAADFSSRTIWMKTKITTDCWSCLLRCIILFFFCCWSFWFEVNDNELFVFMWISANAQIPKNNNNTNDESQAETFTCKLTQIWYSEHIKATDEENLSAKTSKTLNRNIQLGTL